MQYKLHWLSVQRLDYKLCNFIYKCLLQCAPVVQYVSSLRIHVGEINGRCRFRSAAHGGLVVQCIMNKTCGPRSCAVPGSSVLDSLPLAVRNIELTLPVLHKLLKTELLSIQMSLHYIFNARHVAA